MKNIKVTIKSDEDILKEVKGVVGKIEHGEKIKKHEGISFDSIDAMRKEMVRLRKMSQLTESNGLSITG